MNIQQLVGWGIIALTLNGCASVQKNKSEVVLNFASPQELITQKQLNDGNGSAKDYIYDWGAQATQNEPESLYPRKYLSQYCHAHGGKFSLLYRSHLGLVKDHSSRKILASNSNVKQGIGAYQCQTNQGQNWIVSIEPVTEHKSNDQTATRLVSLQTRMMSLQESKNFYNKTNVVSETTSKKIMSNPPLMKNTKPVTEKEIQTKKDVNLKKELEAKKELKIASETQIKSSEKVTETPQSQQLKYYVAARKDLAKGQNQFVACNNAEKAYRYGKLYNTNGSNVYAESGVLVAKCLTNVPAYKSQFNNSKARAIGILQNLANNQNHAGAKNMLKQIQ